MLKAMGKPYESMTLKEVLAAGKEAGIAVPLHLRGANAIHDPKALEEARQYLIAQLNALYMKQLVRRILWVAVLILIVSVAMLAIAGKQYADQHRSVQPALLPLVNRLA